MQPTDAHRNISWTIVILLFSQINIDVEDEVNSGGTGPTPPNQKQQTQEFRQLIANLTFKGDTPVFVLFNQVNPLRVGPQNDYTELSRLNIDKKEYELIKKYETQGVFQESDELADVLQDLKPHLPPSTKLLLITWDHGSVYGMFKKFKVPAGTKAPDIAQKATYVDLLTPDELAQSIKKGLNRNVDLLILMNCWLQNFHTLYGLRDTADCMVGSEGLITSFVYDYSIFTRLANRTAIAIAEDFTQNLLDSYTYKYASTFKLDNDLPSCSIFTTVYNKGFKLFMEEVHYVINKLLELLETQGIAQSVAAYVHDSRIAVFVWDQAESNNFQYFMIDFLAFFTNFTQRIVAAPEFVANKEIQSLTEDLATLQKLHAAYSPNPFIGAEPYSVIGKSQPRTYVGTPSGTGIFFPLNRSNYNDSFYVQNLQIKNQIGFYITANPNWLQFLQKYYDFFG
jgi:hypothetical protein